MIPTRKKYEDKGHCTPVLIMKESTGLLSWFVGLYSGSDACFHILMNSQVQLCKSRASYISAYFDSITTCQLIDMSDMLL